MEQKLTVLSKQSAKFSETQIDDEVVLMVLDSGDFLSLTGTASSIWNLIDGTRDRAMLIAALALEYDVPESRIAPDVDAFLAQLGEAGLISAV